MGRYFLVELLQCIAAFSGESPRKWIFTDSVQKNAKESC